jgi:hypothetical protein
MSEMIERVAKAIWEQAFDPMEHDEAVVYARAAIAAMREPTVGMINSVWASSGDILAWKVFIDEALK